MKPKIMQIGKLRQSAQSSFALFFSLVFIISTLFFLSTIQIAFAEGEVYSVSVDPKEPLILEEFIINIGVRNTGDELEEYVLNVFVSKNGQVKDENSFTFSLQPNRGMIFSPTYIPTSIGQYEIVIKLYDKYKNVLYQTKISDITVISDIGPFDLVLDVLSRTVRPSDEVPLILYMRNAGVKGTDVRVSLSMDCLGQEDMHKDFSVFLQGGGELEKSLTITACDEEGRRDITAKMILFDHAFAESVNEIFINRTYKNFNLEFPKSIKIKQGESKVFDVFIKNIANVAFNNLRLIIENLPLGWTEVNPSIIVNTKPNETAMFIVNISVPKDATAAEYPIRIAVGCDETLVQEDSTLTVITGEFVEAEEVEVGQLISKELQYQLTVFIIGSTVLLVLIVVLRKLIARRSQRYKYTYKKNVLEKIKDIIE